MAATEQNKALAARHSASVDTHHPHVRVSVPEYSTEIIHVWIDLPDGRTVSTFVNRGTNLVVLDIVDADSKGGVEVYRKEV